MAVARDDSVIRGSLIAALILLVLSLALNYFLYRWGDEQSSSEKSKSTQLANANQSIASLSGQLETLKKMLGVGVMSDAEFQGLATSDSGDPDIDSIAQRFVQDVSQMGQAIDPANRNYPAIPEFLVNSLRDRNVQTTQRSDELTRVEEQAKSDVMIAEQATADAKQALKQMETTLAQRTTEFEESREAMKRTNAEIADTLTNSQRDMQNLRTETQRQLAAKAKELSDLKTTIDFQRRRINELQQVEFEVAQGEVTYVSGNLVQVNLGSADGLRPSVVFSVIDADATRVTDSKPKAKVEVIQVRRDHLSICRVVEAPPLSDPIVAGDKIYSPFWAPGRTVKIALAGEIDLDNDGRSDTEMIRGMILAAGGKVVEELDPEVRFLVVGDPMELGGDPESPAVQRKIKELGDFKVKAAEMGVTVIPAWKLMNYIQVISDTKTTPLGSAARGSDFKPEMEGGRRPRVPTDISPLYRDPPPGGDR